MTYEYYKENFNKLTKVERNSNKKFRTKYYEELQLQNIENVKKSIYERLFENLQNTNNLTLLEKF